MTDAGDETSDVPPERTGRRQRVGDSGSPVGSTLSIILAVVAVVAGFLILRALTDDDSSDGETGGNPVGSTVPNGAGGSTTSQPDGTSPTQTTTPGGATTTVPETKTGATIVVVNASGIEGSAGDMSTELQNDGYQGVGAPANSTSEPITESIVYYAPNDAVAQAVASSIAADLGGVQTGAIPEPRPATGDDVATATVLVMVGQDAAGRALADLAGGGGGGTAGDSTVAPPAIVTSTTAAP